MSTLSDASARSTATYNAAADHYDDAANAFWSRFGRATVDRLALRPGSHVLDVCCGSGASALEAAAVVGAQGRVVGADLADNLLGLARAKAQARGLRNIEFRHGDLLDLPVADGAFDAVVCVFGIFFVPDMPLAVRSLWRAVKPGGVLAVTTWGPRWMEPGTTAFWNAVREVRPDLYKGFNPWDRICHPDAVVALLHEGGADGPEAVAEAAMHPIPSPEAWWSVVMGSGYRGTFEQLDAREQARVRDANLRYIRDSAITAVEANVVYATARKR
ncbi:MAG TPA: class I SAM-dependent methyltransferase [Casimicrobiaceae bacterium]|nr:class I SAM-dependent methyltransferase [Casimicrobiaceae bacterium]